MLFTYIIIIRSPPSTSTVERTFSDMKLTKTRIRSTLEEDTLDQTLKLCTEGPSTLSDEDIDLVFRNWKQQKPRQ